MDIKEYISSGVLENYVLGLTSAQETKEVECMSHIYPEIKEELTALQFDFEKIATKVAVNPPKGLRQKIIAKIEKTKQDSPLKVVRSDATPNNTKSGNLVWKLSVAASVVLLIGVSVLWYIEKQEVNRYAVGLKGVLEKYQELESKYNESEDELLLAEKDAHEQRIINDLLAHTTTQRVEMLGTDKSPDSKVSMYFNSETKKSMLKIDNLPNPGDKQYQLWAIVDGTPTDMGVIEVSDSSQYLLSIPCVANAQAFAITLEKKGGNPTPTLSEMYVLGKV